MKLRVCRGDGLALARTIGVLGLLSTLVCSRMAHADEVVMVFNASTPPLSSSETQSGLAVEIVRYALAAHGHTLRPVFLPKARMIAQFATPGVNAIISDEGIDARGIYLGDAVIQFDNRFFTLKSHHIRIRAASDLAGLSLIGFRGTALAHPDLTRLKLKVLAEENDQALMVRTLRLERYDVAFCDIRICMALAGAGGRSTDDLEVQPWQVNRPDIYRTVFKSASIRDDFNAGLAELRQSRKLDELIRHYM